MSRPIAEPTDLSDLWELQSHSARVGRIVKLTENGHALIDYPGNTLGLIEARVLVGLALVESSNCPVLLVFENGDPTLPIIIGLVGEAFQRPTQKQEMTMN